MLVGQHSQRSAPGHHVVEALTHHAIAWIVTMFNSPPTKITISAPRGHNAARPVGRARTPPPTIATVIVSNTDMVVTLVAPLVLIASSPDPPTERYGPHGDPPNLEARDSTDVRSPKARYGGAVR
jgi:hypothetical protein